MRWLSPPPGRMYSFLYPISLALCYPQLKEMLGLLQPCGQRWYPETTCWLMVMGAFPCKMYNLLTTVIIQIRWILDQTRHLLINGSFACRKWFVDQELHLLWNISSASVMVYSSSDLIYLKQTPNREVPYCAEGLSLIWFDVGCVITIERWGINK